MQESICLQCHKQLITALSKNHYMNNHIAEIVNSLYLGSYGMVNESELNYHQITDVINTASEVDYQLDPKYQYCKFSLRDTPDQHLIEHLDSICEYIHILVTNNCKVLVHCFMGISRSASLIIAYLIKYHQMNYDEALSHVLERRHVRPNPHFEEELRKYAETYAQFKENIS